MCSQKMEDTFLNPLAWYEENNIQLHAGVKATLIDRERRVVTGQSMRVDAPAYGLDGCNQATAPIEEAYDKVIIATGSRPFVPPMDGMGKPGTFLFRTLDDCEHIAAYAKQCKKAAVIGGGLLGLEAARG